MAKLTALIILLVAAMAVVASASAYTTVVTTTLTDEKCERETQEQMPMRHCMMYVQSRTKGPYLRSAVANRRFKEDPLQACCDELRQMSAECRCDAVKEMMRGMPQLEMKRMACSLPSRCEMSACACPRLFA